MNKTTTANRSFIFYLYLFNGIAVAQENHLETQRHALSGTQEEVHQRVKPLVFPEIEISSCRQAYLMSKYEDRDGGSSIQRPFEMRGTNSDQLPTYWAQELIGSDLIKDDPFITQGAASIAVVDSGFSVNDASKAGNKIEASKSVREFLDLKTEMAKKGITVGSTHGSNVTQLIGNREQGVSPNAPIKQFHFNANFSEVIQEISSEPKAFSIISASVAAPELYKEATRRQLQSSVPNSIFVMAAGNLFPINSKQSNMGIIVGSSSPDGSRSWFSQKPADILAPADTLISTQTGDSNQIQQFGGSSASTPLVSSTLARLKSLFPDVNEDQARFLLKASGTSTRAQNLNQDATPMLNSYRLMTIAQKLKNAQIPPEKWSGVLSTNSPNSPFNLNSEVAGLQNEINNLVASLAPPTCEKIAALLKTARKKALLSNDQADFRFLASIYKKMGIDYYADSLTNLGKPQNVTIDTIASLEKDLNSSDVEKRIGALQELSDSNNIRRDHFMQMLNTETSPAMLSVVLSNYVENYPDSAEEELLRKINSKEDLSRFIDDDGLTRTMSALLSKGKFTLLNKIIREHFMSTNEDGLESIKPIQDKDVAYTGLVYLPFNLENLENLDQDVRGYIVNLFKEQSHVGNEDIPKKRK
jgi:hypothetical protein